MIKKMQNRVLFIVALVASSMLAFTAIAIEDEELGIHTTKTETSFSSLTRVHKADLIRLAKCAAAAYPDGDCPEGYRAFGGDDWRRCFLGDNVECCTCDTNGFLKAGSGLRARFMRSVSDNEIVIAWSGCDLDQLSKMRTWGAAFLDAKASLCYMCGCTKKQFDEALWIFNRVVAGCPSSKINVVGHSLGGGLVAYVLSQVHGRTQVVRGVTFNGMGMPEKIDRKKIGLAGAFTLSETMENVKIDSDILYLSTKSQKYYGPLYVVSYKKHFAEDKGLVGNVTKTFDAHGIGLLIRLMEKELDVDAVSDNSDGLTCREGIVW